MTFNQFVLGGQPVIYRKDEVPEVYRRHATAAAPRQRQAAEARTTRPLLAVWRRLKQAVVVLRIGIARRGRSCPATLSRRVHFTVIVMTGETTGVLCGM